MTKVSTHLFACLLIHYPVASYALGNGSDSIHYYSGT
jgi:hypothetical protein